MPEVGVRTLDSFALHGAGVAEEALREGTITLTEAEILHLTLEIDDRTVLALLPPALHPTLPSIATFVVWRCGASEVGPFTLAQVRVGCRAGIRGRALLCASVCDSEAAATWLHERRGFECRPGAVSLQRTYDRVTAGVTLDGRSILRLALSDPRVIGVEDIEFTDNLNPVLVRPGPPAPAQPNTTANNAARLRLVQLEPEYLLRRADRGVPLVESFDRAAWSAEPLQPAAPVIGLYCQGEIRLPPVRYLLDPA